MRTSSASSSGNPLRKNSAYPLRGSLEGGRILSPRGEGEDLAFYAARFDEGVVRSGGDDEAARHGQSRAAQLAQVGALAAREGDVVSTYFIELSCERHLHLHRLFEKWLTSRGRGGTQRGRKRPAPQR